MTQLSKIQFPDITLPVSFEAESAILGAIMIKNKYLTEVSEFLEEWHFADETNRRIYACMKTMIEQGKSANPITMQNEFSGDEELLRRGGPSCLSRIADSGALFGIEGYARQIVDLAQRREIIGAAIDAIGEAEQVNIDRGADQIASSLISSVSKMGGKNGGLVTLGSAVDDTIRNLTASENMLSFPTNIRRLDSALGGGLYAGKFYGISARHKCGKTALLLSISYSMLFGSDNPVPHVYICGEMDPVEISQRLLARRLGINSLSFLELQTRGECYVNGEWSTRLELADKVKSIKDDFSNKGLAFQQKPRLTLETLKSTIARAAISGKYRGIIVDYLQMVTGHQKGQSQAEHLDNVAQSLVEAAKQHGLWIIAAAQLNREGFVRGGDGLMNACDMAFVLNREADDNGGYLDHAWLEMSASRYTPYRHLGTKDAPGLVLEKKIGPYFEEMP